MYRTPDGERTLTGPEWTVFRIGLRELVDWVTDDWLEGDDDAPTGVPPFDDLTAEQELVSLAGVAASLRREDVPPPQLTAVGEGTALAVLQVFRAAVREDLVNARDGLVARHGTRPSLLAFHGELGYGEEEQDDEIDFSPPAIDSTEPQRWLTLVDALEERIMHDLDCISGHFYLDLPPEVAAQRLELADIDRDYFTATPPEPLPGDVERARTTLWELIEAGD